MRNTVKTRKKIMTQYLADLNLMLLSTHFI